MANRGYKLQEFVAHSGNINCLRIGRKNFRHFITGGDDHKVNLWSIGKSKCLMSLCGHTSPVESVAFNSTEVLVLAGSSSGAIKLWDLEEIKMVRNLTGHRSCCKTIEFHPFGEFFASGSMDTNLKIWDIRKKECIHTYKGHTRGINSIRFSPDGRWVVSGGFDNLVKVWDLTAGKLLHDFKFHEGYICSIDFHPLECLLATGSADQTVKFWDLETFEMIGSTRRESGGVQSVAFHPDGKTLFCGLDDSLKVYSWEPIICHDSIDMGWSTLGDFCFHDGKLLGGAYYNNFVGIWVADFSRNIPSKKKDELHKSPLERVGTFKKSNSSPRISLLDRDSPEIKNIYVDNFLLCVKSKVDIIFGTEGVVSLEHKEKINQKHSSSYGLRPKSSGSDSKQSLIVPDSTRKSILSGTLKSTRMSRSSNCIFNMEKLSTEAQSNVKSTAQKKKVLDFISRLGSDNNATELSDKFEESSTDASSDQENSNESPKYSEGVDAIKIVSGVEIMRGRTRSLVERFEKREMLIDNEICGSDPIIHAPKELPLQIQISPKDTRDMTKNMQNNNQQIVEQEVSGTNDSHVIENLMQSHELVLTTYRSRLTKLQVVRHFWERKDVKGAINATMDFPDHCVQADIVGALVERMDIITLDLFSSLLPLLFALLDSKVERQAVASLEMLLKLVAIFGSVVRSTVLSPSVIGVDIYAEQRLECCKECFAHLQNIQKVLPLLMRRGGLFAKSAVELSVRLEVLF